MPYSIYKYDNKLYLSEQTKAMATGFVIDLDKLSNEEITYIINTLKEFLKKKVDT